MDVTSTGSIDVALAAAEQGFGPVDVLINNAGVASTALVQTAGSGPAMMSAELPEGGHGQADGRRATVRGSPL
jgi:NAD(P)-dependent dehydrogenase (short-subunit alcohol dehydrogenase family)